MLKKSFLAMCVLGFTFSAHAGYVCERDQILGMSCSSAISGEGIGTSVMLDTMEFQSCRQGKLVVDNRTWAVLIDGGDYESLKASVAPQPRNFVDLDYHPSIIIHMITGAVIKSGGYTYNVTVSGKQAKVDPNSLESYFQGQFQKVNAQGKVVETGELICNVNF